MRTLAIGDIHGCLRALDGILEEAAPQADDLVITLGDYIDRGPDSKGVLDRVLELSERCNSVHLKGNHEVMMLAAREHDRHFWDWLSCGGRQALASYGAPEVWQKFSSAIPEEHWHFFNHNLKSIHETQSHIFVHANLYPQVSPHDQPDYMLFWEKLVPVVWRPHESGKTMICGHTVQKSGVPRVLDRAICIDTWVYGDGWLTCLDVDTGTYWQVNQRGEKRQGRIEQSE